MRLATVLALVLLGACSPVAAPLDASRPADGFVAPPPVCRPLSEDPTCVGACDGFQARCPAGYTAACGGASVPTWTPECGLRGFGGDCPGDGPVRCPSEAPNPACVPPDWRLGCPRVP